jgi:peptidyl-prolyl cis-trans isomerase SurA
MKKILAHWILLMCLAAPLHAQQLVDGVVALVGEEIILKSDVDAQVALFAYQNQVDPKTPGLWSKMLESAINQKILLTKAKLDSIQVSSNELDQLLAQRMAFIKQRLGSDEEVVKYFGKPMAQLRADVREELRSQRMVEELQRKRFQGVTVSNAEVQKFYETFKDSLPSIPAEVEIAHILIRPKVDSLAKQSSLDKIKKIEEELRAGKKFEDLAVGFSEDPGSAKKGGDLGFVRRGEFVKKFEEVAFGLREGQISKIVETEFGFHIIQLIERKGEAIHSRHILIRFDQTKRNDQAAIDRLKEIREQISTGEISFGLGARLYSEDERTAQSGGDITLPQTGANRIPIESIDSQFRDAIEKLKVGDISEPRRIALGGDDYAYHIVHLKYRADAHKMNLEQDYTRIKNFALQQRQAELYEQWLQALRKEVFWKIKL